MANPNYIYTYCSPKSYNSTLNSTLFQSNLNNFLSRAANTVNGFAAGFFSASEGTDPDKVYGLFLCRGDDGPNICKNCVQIASKRIVSECSTSKEAIVWYDQCLLRYSNVSFFSSMQNQPTICTYDMENVTQLTNFNTVLNRTFEDLVHMAAYNASADMRAVGSAVVAGSDRVYGYVQCTPDLSEEDCANCLKEAVLGISNCSYGKQGGRVFTPSCVLRYEMFPFLDNNNASNPASPACDIHRKEEEPKTQNGHLGVGACTLPGLWSSFFVKRKSSNKLFCKINLDNVVSINPPEDHSTEVDVTFFEFSTVKAATDNFSSANKLGQGGFGIVSKGKLPNGLEVAIKRLSAKSRQGVVEFKTEVTLMAKLQHKNLVRLLGCCIDGEEKMLIYEYMQNKSLDYFIFGDQERRSTLDWKKRYDIILGIARGIRYIHQESRLTIIHRDLKASNILLDGEWNPKISDFGTARSFKGKQTEANTTKVAGTIGYISPEYIREGSFSIKSDVFSFGVLLLETISGKKNVGFLYDLEDVSTNFIRHAWSLWTSNRRLEIVDPSMGDSYPTSEVLRCIHVGFLCVQDRDEDRPTMSQVVTMLISPETTLPYPKQPTYAIWGIQDDPKPFTTISRISQNGMTCNIYQKNDKNTSDPERFSSLVNQTLQNLTKVAAFDPSSLYYYNGGARVFSHSCLLRYEYYLFYEVVVMEEQGTNKRKRRIYKAANNFSDSNEVGKGGFGPVYKVVLVYLLDKQTSSESDQDSEKLRNEVPLIMKLQHQNLVSLLGWLDGVEKLLFYEYMPNNSLDRWLFEEFFIFMRIFSLGSSHRDLKASNALLDNDMNPMISDFGTARILEPKMVDVDCRRKKDVTTLVLLYVIRRKTHRTYAGLGADPPFDLCSNTTYYTSNSPFENNLNTLLLSLPSNASSSKFFNTSFGNDPDRVYSLYLCLNYTSYDTCHTCISSASQDITKLCPDNEEAVVWGEDCQLRYSNKRFLGQLDVSGNLPKYNMKNTSEPERFRTVVNQTLHDLTKVAAFSSSSNMCATGEVAFTSTDTIYALVQCTMDLSPSNCSQCLETAISDILGCCYFYRGARLLSRSCYLRYEYYAFYEGQTESSAAEKSNGRKIEISVIATTVFAFSVVLLLGSVVYCLVKRRRTQKDRSKSSSQVVQLSSFGESKSIAFLKQDLQARGDLEGQESPFFDLATISAATNDFSDENKLGQGGYGPVYKGTLSDGKMIAVKRLSSDSEQGVNEFANEVLLIMKLQHKNLVRLLGFCIDGEEKLLIYEYMCNGSLDVFLLDQSKRAQLDWKKRANIIHGIAKGVLYLHQDSCLRIIHRDLKPSNVLLDAELNPKISDFGTARIFGGNGDGANTATITGTYGYMAPEYAMQGLYSIKSDVFSFGVLILEIITGRRNAGFHLSKCAPSLLAYAWQLWNEERELELIDPLLNDSISEDEFLQFLHIALLCVQEDSFDRPTMTSVVLMLKGDSIALCQPQRPAFSVGTFADHYETVAIDHSTVNVLTVSDISGR
ncbi:Serine-threonine/tyrosine-protein kinase, catalytic domain [Dillenia turbinata]|uniref:non-specific serine/threonine protein kinase n=1 Tax=Dillenia turbinata TaxID=194707 RepID=A0AAN8UKW1_9MAGN